MDVYFLHAQYFVLYTLLSSKVASTAVLGEEAASTPRQLAYHIFSFLLTKYLELKFLLLLLLFF